MSGSAARTKAPENPKASAAPAAAAAAAPPPPPPMTQAATTLPKTTARRSPRSRAVKSTPKATAGLATASRALEDDGDYNLDKKTPADDSDSEYKEKPKNKEGDNDGDDDGDDDVVNEATTSNASASKEKTKQTKKKEPPKKKPKITTPKEKKKAKPAPKENGNEEEDDDDVVNEATATLSSKKKKETKKKAPPKKKTKATKTEITKTPKEKKATPKEMKTPTPKEKEKKAPKEKMAKAAPRPKKKKAENLGTDHRGKKKDDLMLEKLQAFRTKYPEKNCNVPDKWKEDKVLAHWVSQQRLSYHENKISPERIKILEEWGFCWKLQHSKWYESRELGWDDMMKRLLAFHIEFGHANVPIKYEKDKPLGRWVKNQRDYRERDTLSTNQVERLDALGFCWRCKKRHNWDEMLDRLMTYKAVNGDCIVSQSYKPDPQLGKWCQNQRAEYNKQKMAPDRITKLEALGFVWRLRDPAVERTVTSWDDMLAKLQAYKIWNGHCNVPGRRYKADPSLGIWVESQRSRYKQEKLSPEKIQKLESMDFVWCHRWNKMLEQLKAFKVKYGHSNVTRTQYTTPDQEKLVQWVAEQRAAYIANKVSADRISKLQAVDLVFRPNDTFSSFFDALKAYKAEHGHTNVPNRSKEYPLLARQVNGKRHEYSINSLTKDRIVLMESLGFVWRPRDKAWDDMFDKLRQHKSQYGNCDATRSHGDDKLVDWISQQRLRIRPGDKFPLSEDRKGKLNALGFTWKVFDAPAPIPWDGMLLRLKAYRDTHGDCLVGWKHTEDPRLKNWVNTQRALYGKKKMTAERIAKLEGLGFVWVIRKVSLIRKNRAPRSPSKKGDTPPPPAKRQKISHSVAEIPETAKVQNSPTVAETPETATRQNISHAVAEPPETPLGDVITYSAFV